MARDCEYGTDDVPVEGVLEGARVCQTVLVLGWDARGELYAAASTADASVLWALMETFKEYYEGGRYG